MFALRLRRLLLKLLFDVGSQGGEKLEFQRYFWGQQGRRDDFAIVHTKLWHLVDQKFEDLHVIVFALPIVGDLQRQRQIVRVHMHAEFFTEFTHRGIAERLPFSDVATR